MNILLLGDIMGPSGRKAVIEKLPKIIKKKKIDFVIVNGENAGDLGVGITKKYFNQLEGEKPCGVYSMVLKEVEFPLLRVVMEQCNGNQSHASEILGINRGTLRTKLKEYKLL